MRYQVFISGTPTPSKRPSRRAVDAGERNEASFQEVGRAAEAGGGIGETGRHTDAGGSSRDSCRPAGSDRGKQGDTSSETRTSPQTFVRRFPPVLQFLKHVDPVFEQQAQALVLQWYRKGMTLDQVCDALHEQARMLGFEATLGVQEVFSSSMPSFPNQTVTSALLMIDLNRIEAPGGFHRRRVAM